MATTIQIENPTKKMLNELKSNYNSKTFDEVIVTLLKKREPSMYSKFFKGKKISAKAMMKGLREKNDRY